MKVAGFSFIKNALIYDYPIAESIKSILPICDELIVAVGKSEDATLSLIQSLNSPKIKIIETVWDENLREGGRVLASETDKAFANISTDADWAFYIQGDEVVHEKDLAIIYQNMLKYKDNAEVDGLLFNYLHFYGSYDFIGASSNWYKKEIRVIKNNKSIYSHKDAQGFRKKNNEKLNVAAIDAYIYHYGMVKDVKAMQKKHTDFDKYWHDDKWIEEHVIQTDAFDYGYHVKELKPFVGEHPTIMQQRIAEKNWKFEYDISKNRKSFKDKAKYFLSKYVGLDFNYKNYKIVAR